MNVVQLFLLPFGNFLLCNHGMQSCSITFPFCTHSWSKCWSSVLIIYVLTCAPQQLDLSLKTEQVASISAVLICCAFGMAEFGLTDWLTDCRIHRNNNLPWVCARVSWFVLISLLWADTLLLPLFSGTNFGSLVLCKNVGRGLAHFITWMRSVST